MQFLIYFFGVIIVSFAKEFWYINPIGYVENLNLTLGFSEKHLSILFVYATEILLLHFY